MTTNTTPRITGLTGYPIGYSLIANSTTASISVSTTPAVIIPTYSSNTDPAFNAATGITTFDTDCLWSSTVSVSAMCASGAPTYYTDAEYSIDGGTTWIRGSNSLRAEQLPVNYIRTREFSFSGHFSAGTKLRFVEWASTTGVTLQTTTVGTSTIPARRITYLRIPSTILTE